MQAGSRLPGGKRAAAAAGASATCDVGGAGMRTYWSLFAQLIWLPTYGLPRLKAAEGWFPGRLAGMGLHLQQRVQLLACTALLRADKQCALTLCSLSWSGACLPCRRCRTPAGATLATSTSPSAPSTAAPATGKLAGLWFCLGFRAPRVVRTASCFVCCCISCLRCAV